MTHRSVHRGFTLVELMLSVVLIGLLAIILASMTSATASSWKYTSSKIEQFRSATSAFETITRRLSQATLNTSWDYHYPNGMSTGTPDKYVRQSDLRFIAGKAETLFASSNPLRPTHSIFFQAPAGYVDDTVNFSGLENLLNTWGYYIEYNEDTIPPFLQPLAHPLPPQAARISLRNRWRLMEYMQPSNRLTIYSKTSGNPNYTGHEWFLDGLSVTNPPTHVLAENIIAMVLLPKLSTAEDPTGIKLAPTYDYDSTVDTTALNPSADPELNPKNQLPPVVQVSLVAIDEASAVRMSGNDVNALTAELEGLFVKASQFEADLRKDPTASSDASLESYLIKHKINYRIFTANVSLRGAKWSRK
ncbi:uncharacterized protein (TIGR02599 family) [Chthoniobacter flavus]|uniref:Verru_Chthon cassette protein C n=1 Tax=Chthoniobacter flavus TaxID=191863 RepID=UPI00105057C2|nr:Verru_Chthon cassette protein C [Chthoniobacter flavus]TCO87383.1 uncharacterized protein (TIGR02599 family) [Chthoniobacter flavus]